MTIYSIANGMKPIVPVKLEVGAKVRYTGDMANASGLGVVVAVKEKTFGASYQIVMDDGRDKTVDAYSFDGGPGCRFFVMPGIAGADEIAGLLANAAIVAAKAKADEDAPAAAPTVEDYRAGNAWNVSPIEGGSYGRDNWQSLINVKCSEISA